MTDNAIGTFNLLQGSSFAFTALTIGTAAAPAPVLKFEVGDGFSTFGADQLNVSRGISLGSNGAVISVAALSGGTSVATGDFNLITAASGLGSGFTLSQSSFVLGSSLYTLSLSHSTGTNEVLSISSQTFLPTLYWTGLLDGNWTTGAGGSPSNWALDPSGADSLLVPNAASDVFFTANSASNLTTTLAADFSIKGLTFTGTGTPAETNVITIGGSNTLTLGVDGLTVQAGSAGHLISAPVGIGASQTWMNNSTNALTVSGPISGAASNVLSINGTSGIGTVILSATNSTFSGTISVASGALQLGSAQAAQSNSVVISVTNGLQFSAGISPTIGSLSGSGGVTLADVNGNPITLTEGNNSQSTTYSGLLGGPGKSSQNRRGNLLPHGTNSTYSGSTTINAGILKISADASLGSTNGRHDHQQRNA